MTTHKWNGDKIVPIKSASFPKSAPQAEKLLSDTALRVVRTFVQAVVAALATAPAVTNWSGEKDAAAAALFAGATAVVALVHNTLENVGVLPSTK